MTLNNPNTKKPKAFGFTVVDNDKLNHELFKKNMLSFSKHQVEIAKRISQIQNPTSRIVQNDDDSFDIEYQGSRLYGIPHNEWKSNKIDNYLEPSNSRRINLNPPDSNSLDEVANLTLYRLLKEATDSGLSFSSLPQVKQSTHLVLFGFGLGVGLDQVIENSGCQNLIIIEPNPEFLYWSFYFFDWEKLLESNTGGHKKITIIPQIGSFMDYVIRLTITDQNGICIDSTRLFLTYPNRMMEQTIKEFMKNGALLITGLGFLEDEIDMLRNSYKNLKYFKGQYFQVLKSNVSQPINTAIVGNGPSLDNNLEFLRQNQDRMIIVSCGTSIQTLLHNGIKPDFQMEMENVPLVVELTEKLSKKHDLSGITLFAANTIDSGVSQFYDKTIYFIRPQLISQVVFNPPGENKLHNISPTVANLGVSFSQLLGAKNNYLFGVDLGTVEIGKHHAKDSAYNSGEVEFTAAIDVPSGANFGGKAYGEAIYDWSRNTMEASFNNLSSDRHYYNCSDGCRIKNSIPILSETIELPEFPNKAEFIEHFYTNFPSYNQELFDLAWNDWDRRSDLKTMNDLLLSKLEDATGSSPSEHMDCSTTLWRTLIDIHKASVSGEIKTPESHYYKGSTTLLLLAIHFYYNRLIGDDETRLTFINMAHKHIKDHINRIFDEVSGIYDDIDNGEWEPAQ